MPLRSAFFIGQSDNFPPLIISNREMVQVNSICMNIQITICSTGYFERPCRDKNLYLIVLYPRSIFLTYAIDTLPDDHDE